MPLKNAFPFTVTFNLINRTWTIIILENVEKTKTWAKLKEQL